MKTKNMKIGCHLSISKGYAHMGKEALKIDANTFQFFSRNPRGGQAKEINPADSEELLKIMKENDFAKILAHAPYTLNACSKDPSIRNFAKNVLADDLERMDTYFPGNLYNFHPGSHTGQGVEKGIEQIVEALNDVLKPDMKTTVLLETMSGKGSEIGRSFEEIAEIIEKTELKDNLGVCLDTCHIYSAGYDIINEPDEVLDEFDNIIGLKRLHAIHLNDSMTPFNSNKDRHEKIGYGTIGLKAIVDFINNKRIKFLPFYLETPNEVPGFAKEIKCLRKEFL